MPTASKDLDIAHSTFPLSVVMERKPAFIKLGLRDFVPFFQRETDFFKKIPRLKLRRTITTFAFELWTTCAGNIKKPFPSEVQADNHCVKGVARFHAQWGCVRWSNLLWLQPKAIDAVIAVSSLRKWLWTSHKSSSMLPNAYSADVAHLILIGTTIS